MTVGTSPKKTIALSAGGDNAELAAHGLGIEHVDELMVRLSRQLLQAGHRLAYGGALGDPDVRLTELLIDAAVRWLNDDDTQKPDIVNTSSWPLVNYGAWPYHAWVREERKAQLVGVCEFVSINPPGVHPDALAARRHQWKTDPIARRYVANSLSEMRERSTRETDARIVWGGRIRGANGWMPGIAEEVLFSIQLGKPVLILGGFGGCASLLADFIGNSEASWPEALTFADACQNKTYAEQIENDAHRRDIAGRFEELERLVTRVKHDLQAQQDIAGIRASTFEEALKTASSRRAMQLALKVAKRPDQ